jgi:hypothetical protein
MALVGDLGRVLIKRADRSALTLCYATAKYFLRLRFTVVQKIEFTGIVDQAHNSNKRPLLRGPTDKRPFGSGLTLSGPLSRRRSSARKNEHDLAVG